MDRVMKYILYFTDSEDDEKKDQSNEEAEPEEDSE